MSSETQTHGAERFESLGNASGAATQADIIEWFILLGVVLIVTGLRTYARISTMGLSNLGWDDILVWVALVRNILHISIYPSYALRRGQGSRLTTSVPSSSTGH